MLDLARKAAELLVARSENLLAEGAWDGEFRLKMDVLAKSVAEDRALFSSTTLHGTFSLRLCIINHNTSWEDVRETLDTTERFGLEVLKR